MRYVLRCFSVFMASSKDQIWQPQKVSSFVEKIFFYFFNRWRQKFLFDCHRHQVNENRCPKNIFEVTERKKEKNFSSTEGKVSRKCFRRRCFRWRAAKLGVVLKSGVSFVKFLDRFRIIHLLLVVSRVKRDGEVARSSFVFGWQDETAIQSLQGTQSYQGSKVGGSAQSGSRK